jgi:hypothetical protein
MTFENTLAQAIAAAIRVAITRYLPIGPHQSADHDSIEAEMVQAAATVLLTAEKENEAKEGAAGAQEDVERAKEMASAGAPLITPPKATADASLSVAPTE